MTPLATSVLVLGAALLVVVLAPRLLATRAWQVRWPTLALGAWTLAVLLGAALASAALAVLVVDVVSGPRPAQGLVGGVATTLGAWGGLALTGAALLVTARHAGELARADATDRRAVRGTLELEAQTYELRDGVLLVRTQGDGFGACAAPGDVPLVAWSIRTEEALGGAGLRAVLAHELAHLRRRHHTLLWLAELNARCVPHRFRAGRAPLDAVRLLVELVADDVAARQAGAPELAAALRTLGRLTENPSLDLRAARVEQRHPRRGAAHLTSTGPVPHPPVE
ncbi:hypothetical protein IGS67_08730 [Flavimobilis sp. GY10621]|uniref:Peptidase family M48 n=1 Tax=Flavimobilis rhizosphaerae TaxID=2775421 RepID=A0ABR9DR31_9MICO|nr:hypothetical protein [Flavimobilis rhizosphaerae]MBD9699571.1 hypothetical protein [Flavimobilis rhizosphaerae]